MLGLAYLLLIAVLASAAMAGHPARAGEAATAADPWILLARHEEKALRDYEWRRVDSDVIDNGRELRKLSRSPDFAERHVNCGLAARTLSHMVTGQYYSARRLAISADWHGLSADYARHRRACLAELNLDERDHPLADWFGK